MLWGTYFFDQGVITNPLVRDAMDAIKRKDFLPPEERSLADDDHPIEIGFGQTNSQPYTVAFMLNLLDPQPGMKVLDIGSGSGWTSAMLAWIVSGHSSNGNGRVYAVERIPELVKWGETNAHAYGFVDSGILTFIQSDGSLGFHEQAPYDRILASASFDVFPEALTEQLSDKGILVVPVERPERGIRKAVKQGTRVHTQFSPGFVFVPMISATHHAKTARRSFS